MTCHLIKKELLRQALASLSEDDLALLPSEIPLSLDSRSLCPGDVFIALIGEHSDGHDHLAQAYAKGAKLAIAQRDKLHGRSFSSPLITVDDSLNFFSTLASLHLKSLSLTKIAITGSNGKTTTKEMVKALLGQVLGAAQVFANDGTLNNHFGVPKSALSVTPAHKVAIFEMGMNHSHEIEGLCSIVKPDIGAITNIGVAHEGNFLDGILGIQRAKGELFFDLAQRDGHAIVNLDDERVVALADQHKLTQRTSFGFSKTADLRIVSCEAFCPASSAQEISIATADTQFSFSLPLLGSHQALNAACALSVVQALGLSVKEAAVGFLAMPLIKGRMNLSYSHKGYIVINDGYNANPISLRAGVLASLEIKATRRIAVIGAMKELGEKSAQHHFDLGTWLPKYFDHLFIAGLDAYDMVKGAEQALMPKENIIYRDESVELIKPLESFLKAGDLVFIKGSKASNMQVIAHAIDNDEEAGL